MGILGLWDVLGEGEVLPLATYAARHFEQHKRPLRIAVDEACWRFTNVTPEQAQKIREGEPAANPVEKVILWRILRLLRLNVQLIFVDDGPKRPWKRRKRGGGKLDFEIVRLLRRMLDQLKIPQHRAPAEAEAECARMQAEGIVDAVWSDDGDAFMFGCGVLIKAHKIGQQRVNDIVRIYRARDILEKHDLDAESLVMFAMLAGGDYNVEGLRGCGPKTAALMSKRERGLAKALCRASQYDLPGWTHMLRAAFGRHGKTADWPAMFPDFRALGHYRNPVVSTPEQLRGLRTYMHGWEGNLNQSTLRPFLRDRFNFTTREFIKHISPVFLARRLARTRPETRESNLQFGIQLKRTVQKEKKKKKTDEEGVGSNAERKIIFSPLGVLEIDLSHQPADEDWSKFAKQDGTPYDPLQNIECEMLECLLQYGLPDDALQTAAPAARNKRKADTTTEESPTKKRKATSTDAKSQTATATDPSVCVKKRHPSSVDRAQAGNGIHPGVDASAPRKRRRPKKMPSVDSVAAKGLTSKSKRLSGPTTPAASSPPAVFQLPRSYAFLCDLDDNDPEGFEDSLFVTDWQSPIAAQETAGTARGLSVLECKSVRPQFWPGEAIPPASLRAMRATSGLFAQPPNHWGVDQQRREVIDLT